MHHSRRFTSGWRDYWISISLSLNTPTTRINLVWMFLYGLCEDRKIWNRDETSNNVLSCQRTRSTLIKSSFSFPFTAINLPVFLIPVLSCSLCPITLHTHGDYINVVHLNQWNYFLCRIWLENRNNVCREQKRNPQLYEQFGCHQSRELPAVIKEKVPVRNK